MILVTGANGFLGRRLVKALRAAQIEAIPLSRGNAVTIAPASWEADLSRSDHIAALEKLAPCPDTIIHLAGMVKVGLGPNPAGPSLPPVPREDDVAATYLANVVATANILDFSLRRGVKHIIFASSQTVYGLPDGEALTEQSPCAPLEHYAASKLCGEELLRLGVQQGVSVTCLRFPGLYGEERTSGVVYNFCRSALQNKTIAITASFPLPLDVIHVEDVAAAFVKAARRGGDGWSCFNIATGEPCNLGLLADAIAELVPGCRVEHTDLVQPVVRMDPSRAKELLDWEAIPRRERLSAMLRHMTTNRRD